MRKYIFRDIHGNRIEQQANSFAEAVRHSGVNIAGVRPEPNPAQHCGGDCGDCNDARECATQEQAK